MRIRATRCLLILVCGLVAGCGGGNSGRPAQTGGAHGGTTVATGGAMASGGSIGAGGGSGTRPTLDAGQGGNERIDAQETGTPGCTLADTIAVDRLPPLAFTSYHTLAAISAYLADVAAAVPDVARAEVLGQSVRGRAIPYLVINATCQPTPAAVLLVGTHHGDEGSSAEATLAHVDSLLRGSADVRDLLDRYAFYVLPVLNVDGYEASPPTRENADGVDINRDYAYPERGEPSSFKERETQLLKTLQDQVGFRAALTYHSGTTSVLWPWCYTATPAADDARLSSVGAKTAQAMGFGTYSASYFDYPTQGEYIDYAYMKSKTLAFTVEVSVAKTPPASALPEIVATTWKGTLALVQALQSNHAPAVAVPSQILQHAPRRGDQRLE